MSEPTYDELTAELTSTFDDRLTMVLKLRMMGVEPSDWSDCWSMGRVR